jgi:hypothetical protein
MHWEYYCIIVAIVIAVAAAVYRVWWVSILSLGVVIVYYIIKYLVFVINYAVDKIQISYDNLKEAFGSCSMDKVSGFEVPWIIGGSLLIVIAAFCIVAVLLGFTTAGIGAGSCAAAVQSPEVAAGSCFAICQSLGATGTLVGVGVVCLVAAIILFIALIRCQFVDESTILNNGTAVVADFAQNIYNEKSKEISSIDIKGISDSISGHASKIVQAISNIDASDVASRIHNETSKLTSFIGTKCISDTISDHASNIYGETSKAISSIDTQSISNFTSELKKQLFQYYWTW